MCNIKILFFVQLYLAKMLVRCTDSPTNSFSNTSPGQASLLLCQVKQLLQLILVMPATNATSERSFSALRRLKSYLRSTMGNERLNHLMVLHVHKERTDKLDLKCVLNEFVGESVHRTSIFAKYS